MKTKTHTNKLQKSSGLFMQLGLVLILTTVYALFEHKTEITTATAIENRINDEELDVIFNPDVIIIEREVVKEKQIPKQKTKFVKEFKISDKLEEKETELPFEPIDHVEEKDIMKGLVDIEDEEKPIIENVDFLKIEDVPIFPGCEKMKTQADKKTCFVKKMDKFIQRKFNSDLANQLGLTSGVKRIYVQFKITKTGEIEISEVRAPHIRLEKEGKRVISLLPKMTPGKQRGVPVNVTYMKPIAFSVQ